MKAYLTVEKLYNIFYCVVNLLNIFLNEIEKKVMIDRVTGLITESVRLLIRHLLESGNDLVLVGDI